MGTALGAVHPRQAQQDSDPPEQAQPEKAQKETKRPQHLCPEAIFFQGDVVGRPLLLLGRIARRVGSAESTTGRRIRAVLHSRRRRAESIAAAKTAAIVAAAAGLPVEVWRALLAESLQLGLVRSHDDAAPVHRRIINKRPILILVLVIELADRLIFADAGNSYDWPADNLARPQLIASRIATTAA